MPLANRFTLRSLEEGKKVNLAWKAETTTGKLILERAGKDGEYLKIAENLGADASFTDENPNSGWNYYRLLDENGTSVATQEVFVKGKSELKVFPNPSTDFITLSMSGCDDINDGYVLVFNALTKCVMEKQIRFEKGNTARIDISELEEGVYTLVLQTNGATLSKPILVSR
jgi:hypothetical protein